MLRTKPNANATDLPLDLMVDPDAQPVDVAEALAKFLVDLIEQEG